MPKGARRLLIRPLRRCLRRVQLAFACFALGAGVTLACAPEYRAKGLKDRSSVGAFQNAATLGMRHESWASRSATLQISAGYAQLSDEYGHNIMGDVQDAKQLTIAVSAAGSDMTTCPTGVNLTRGHVFEDIKPHLWDMTGNGIPEVITVQSSTSQGARAAIYDRHGQLVDATPYIGRRNRWLAMLGGADFDQNGSADIAYIDRPHLAKRLRIWSYEKGGLQHKADLPGYTNHRIGEEDIAGGIRTCNGPPEMILATGDWSKLVAVRFDGSAFHIKTLGQDTSRAAFARAMICKT